MGVMIWAVGALLAILGHAIWTIYGLVGGRKGEEVQVEHRRVQAQQSREELERQMGELARRGEYRLAIALLRDYVLKGFGEVGELGWRETKTNGEFLREVEKNQEHYRWLDGLLGKMEAVVYGGENCTAERFGDLVCESRQLMSHVGKK